MVGPLWDNVSAEAKELIRSLMAFDAGARLKVDQVLCPPITRNAVFYRILKDYHLFSKLLVHYARFESARARFVWVYFLLEHVSIAQVVLFFAWFK